MNDHEEESDGGGVGAAIQSDTPILPPAAMFAIPTHATTHASSSLMGENAEELDSSPTAFQGRPLPDVSSLVEGELVTHDPQYQTGKRMRKGLWRSADTILANNLAMMRVDPQFTSTQHVTYPKSRDIGSSASPYVDEAARQKVILPPLVPPPTKQNPPKYRRGKFVVSPQTPPDYDATREGVNIPPVRFPRWRGWLEKRAMERSDDLQNTAARDGQVHRKKSWGTGVNDADAVSEATEQDNDMPFRRTSPLHIHHFGSRFIPHLPSLPLCFVSLDIPPTQSWSTARLLRRSTPEHSKRKVLLIGAQDGLYAVEFKKEKKTEEVSWSESFQRREFERLYRRQSNQTQYGKWNGNVRTCKVWSGIGVYQMSILQPQASDENTKPTAYGTPARTMTNDAQERGILLALCVSVKKEAARISTTYKTSQSLSHPDLISAIGASTSSSLGHGQRESNAATLLSAAYVGTGGGGGQSKPTPPHGSGDVRMWNLEAIRRIVAHVLDSADHKALDLARLSRSEGMSTPKQYVFASRIRKAWAHLGEPSAERKRFSRQPAREPSPSPSAAVVPHASNRLSTSADYFSQRTSTPKLTHVRAQSEQMLTSDAMYSPGEGYGSPLEEPSVSNSAYQECIKLAHGWVPLTLPGAHPYAASAAFSARTDSVSSLFSDEQGATSPGGSSTPAPPVVSTMGHGKGIAFYALIEAGPEVQGVGTWYLALVQGKSILLYESIRPLDKSDARTWAFVKEFYTPTQAKVVSFLFSESPDPDEVVRNSYVSGTTSSSKRQLTARRSVKSSSYSSVFRSQSSLSIFVSLGKKAVLIRASDGNVKEIELYPMLRRFNTDGGDQYATSSDIGHNQTSKSSTGHGTHTRKGSDMHHDVGNAASKEQWVGLERITAQVVLRCKPSPKSAETIYGAHTTTDAAPALVDDDDDWDSDDANDVSTSLSGGGERGVTLRDTPAATNVTSMLRRPQRTPHSPSYTIFAGMAALSKGTETQILPLPLPRDVFQPRPLHVVHWSALPTGITASARVVGLERDLSSAAVPVDSLGRSGVGVGGAYSPSSPSARNAASSSKSNVVILHVIVALLATLPSRLEMKRVRIRLPVRTPFAFRRDSELELEPIAALASHFDDETSDAPLTNVGTSNAMEAHQELEYLCGLALPTPFDQLSGLKPWEAAGDGGAWAFDWRGANDFRLFYVGTQL